MNILEAYQNAEFRNKISIVATLIKLSLADGVLDENEMKIIKRVSGKYGFIDPEDIDYLIKNYEKFNVTPTYDYNERIEELYYLSKIIYADGHIDKAELKILKNAIVALGFLAKKVDDIYEKAVGLTADDADLDDFIKDIKKVNISD